MIRILFITFIGISTLVSGLINRTETSADIRSEASYNYIIPNDTIKTCLDCHAGVLEHEEVHAPAKKDCGNCHQSNGKEHPLDNVQGFALADKVPDLCYKCHDPKNEEDHVHPPVAEGKCLICHSPHGSPNLYVLTASPTSKLCYDCHDLEIPVNNVVHQPVTDGNCEGCHNPHQSYNEDYLKFTGASLCKRCHRNIRKDQKLEHVHPPFKKDCASCHQHHSSKEAHLTDYKPKDLCISCHEEYVTTMHQLPLVHGAINEEKSCLNCHTPHASAEKKIIRAKEKELCMDCHNESITTITGSITNIGELLKEGNIIHGAIEKEGCTICHNPHASNEHTLLVSSFPIEEYAYANTDNFALCFKCHDKELFENPVTTTATNFRNGDQNLHFTHINGNKGRNCNLCHDVHGSKNEHLIDDKTSFGKWEMPINYTSLENGGTCSTGCHAEKKYIRYELPDSLKIGN
ncbi:MAG: hypothetical protein OEW67_06840 [Cyclobacteriaceae bacterium]|nr:hypothetical protein [Cyclobacteriaceae bacterium]